jgi:hypothetical protein
MADVICALCAVALGLNVAKVTLFHLFLVMSCEQMVGLNYSVIGLSCGLPDIGVFFQWSHNIHLPMWQYFVVTNLHIGIHTLKNMVERIKFSRK